MDMEGDLGVRKRKGGPELDAARQHPEQQSSFPAMKPSSKKLVKTGAAMYKEAELSNFQDRDKLEQSLNLFTEAAEEGEQDAIGWINNFLTSMHSTLPSTVILPR